MSIEAIKKYIDKFNRDDTEYVSANISNSVCFDWLYKNIPHIEIPDKTIEEVYYFRYWVLRKHIKDTCDGKVITEFLVPVSWASTHNTIVVAIDHHTAEAKWLKNAPDILESYFELFLTEKSDPYRYSTPIVDSIYKYCEHIGQFEFGIKNLDNMINYYRTVENERSTPSGLMWCLDDHDAMEFTISGTSEDLKLQKGFRLTMNCYMAANALAISKFAQMAKRDDIADEFMQKHLSLKDRINNLLWDGSFYKAIHGQDLSQKPGFETLPPEQNVREIMGYVPWAYSIAPEGRDKAFEQLRNPEGFYTPYGLSTAEKRHPRYLFDHPHECLWNGYIWPFATSLVLNSMLELMKSYNQDTIDKKDFYSVLSTYAKSHHLITGDKTTCWIDEVMSPLDGSWHSRNMLKSQNWPEKLGGFERGKDYNHSAFCNYVLGGLLGIEIQGAEVSVNPCIPDDWEYFRVSNLAVGDSTYCITYRKGEKTIITKE